MSDLGVAVVTGAARGIGRAIAADLREAGYRVVLTDIRGAEEAAAELGATGRTVDVADGAAVGALVDEIEATLGPIAVWVNNAGVMPSGPFAESEPRLTDAVIDVNYRGVVHATRHVLPRMLERRSGAILNIASGTATRPLAGLAVYSGTKAAVVGFTRALRRELRGTGVTVHAILPYLAATAMGAGMQGRIGIPPVTPAQVSAAALRALRRGRTITYVPGFLGPLLAGADLLPLWVQDALDDLAGTDQIGLGGDPALRAAYRAEVASRVNER